MAFGWLWQVAQVKLLPSASRAHVQGLVGTIKGAAVQVAVLHRVTAATAVAAGATSRRSCRPSGQSF